MARELKKAIALGFHNGARVRPGDTFYEEAEFTGAWFVTVGSEAEAAATVVEEGTLLDQPAVKIVAELKNLSDAELNALLSAEQAGKTRKGVLAAINDELANRVTSPPTAGARYSSV